MTDRSLPRSVFTYPTGESENLGLQAYQQLREAIICMDLPPGALLSEGGLAESLNLSRTPVREALQRLEREYLVEIRPRRGISVTLVDVAGQLQLLELRRSVEMRLLIRGTERAGERQRAVLADLAGQMKTCATTGEWRDYYRWDAEFDAQMDLAVANRYLTEAMQPVHALVRRFWRMHQGSDALYEALRIHAEMVQAASEGEAEKVREILSELYDFNEKFMLSLLS